MILAIIFLAMTLAVLGIVIFPMLRRAGAVTERAAFDQAVYRDQLRELDRDLTRGLIAAPEAQAARLEIQRRMLAADAPATTAAPTRTGRSPVLALAVAVLMVGGAVGIYGRLGDPTIPASPYAARVIRAPGAQDPGHDMNQAILALEERLKTEPDNAERWLLFARSVASLGQWTKAIAAYEKLRTLVPDDPDINAGYGEMLVMAAEGIVTPAAEAAFKLTLAKNPQEEVARFYIALADMQAGRAQQAINAWLRLSNDVASDSPLRQEANRRIVEAAKSAGLPTPALPQVTAPAPASPAAGPDAAAVAASADMTPEQRTAMIRGMVTQLAAKLEATPGDSDAWMRLARSYMVLGEFDKAAGAYDHAAALRPTDITIPLQEAGALIDARSEGAPMTPRVMTVLRRAEAIDPNRPEILWYLGEAAAQERRPAEAVKYWERLLPLLTPGSENHRNVTAALAAIKGG
jgi:cytochrome c-type biogenesis protein CcmH